MLQVPDNFIDLIHITFRIVMLDSELIAVCFSDRAVFIRPCIPDAGPQFPDIVAFGLPDPEKLVYGRLPICAAYRQYREFFGEIVSVDYSEFLDGMCGSSVFPAGPHFSVRVPDSVVYYISAIRYEYLIGKAHSIHSSLISRNYSITGILRQLIQSGEFFLKIIQKIISIQALSGYCANPFVRC